MADWIKGAIKKPGSFRASARKQGLSTKAYAEKKKDSGGKVGKRANLALTLMGMHGH